MLTVAGVLKARATCGKNQVGCVLTDKFNRIIGSGYNGVPRGYIHCTEIACPGRFEPKGSDTCQAVHAEQNALLTCRDPYAIDTCYVTCPPCLRCTKLLLNTSCRRIFYMYGDEEPHAKQMWESSSRIWQEALYK